MSQKMNRRSFLRKTATGLGAAALGTSFIHNCSGSSKQPNIIFLLTDDQRWDAMGAMGNKIIKTPNMDKLAHDGTLFTNAFVTTAICCTSRASIFTGQWARRHGINDFSTDFSDEQKAMTYHQQLRQAGYRTGFIGKYGVGKNLPSKDFDYWKGIPGQPKYEHIDENGQYKHLTQIMGEQSIEFLQDCSQDKPFCLSISFKAPHVQDSDPRQFLYDPAYKDFYKDVDIPLPKTADPKFWQTFPDFFKENSEARRRWEIRFSTPEKYQESVKGYYRLVYGVDVVIGKIRQELEHQGLADNTVIMLLGDNGFYLGEHGLAGKWFGHEESIRVPLMIYDPRIPQTQKGQVLEQMALNVDMAPTMLDLAGLPIPAAMQGKSLLPVMEGQAKEWRQDFLYEHLFKHPGIPQSEGVVGKKYKYIRYIEQSPVYEELYDLKQDPHEEHNLALDRTFAGILDQMREKTDALIEKTR